MPVAVNSLQGPQSAGNVRGVPLSKAAFVAPSALKSGFTKSVLHNFASERSGLLGLSIARVERCSSVGLQRHAVINAIGRGLGGRFGWGTVQMVSDSRSFFLLSCDDFFLQYLGSECDDDVMDGMCAFRNLFFGVLKCPSHLKPAHQFVGA